MARLLVVLALFSAVSAIAGGVELVIWRAGNRYQSLTLLEHTPFATFLVPGLILAIVVGGTSLACGILTARRSRAGADATMLAGGALTVWILAEAAMMRQVHPLHVIYGTLGLTILLLGVRAAWRSRLPRHRWVIAVTVAETTGFLVPACAGVLSTRAGLSDASQAALVVAGGFVEGLAFGAAQAWAFPLPVRRLRYALLSAGGAALAWASAMSMTLMVHSAALRIALIAVAGVATALVSLGAIGTAQWLELRHHTSSAHRWIAWTALAWLIALPLSFTPAPFVDEATPLVPQIVLWGCAGLLMAHVMALITWQGARRMTPLEVASVTASTQTRRAANPTAKILRVRLRQP